MSKTNDELYDAIIETRDSVFKAIAKVNTKVEVGKGRQRLINGALSIIGGAFITGFIKVTFFK